VRPVTPVKAKLPGTPWILACDGRYKKYPWGFRCERCGEHQALPKELSVKAYLAWAEFFIAQHKGCKESEKAPVNG